MTDFTVMETDEGAGRLCARVFAGELVVLRGLPQMAALVEATRAFLGRHLGGSEPTRIHERHEGRELAALIDELQRAYRKDADIEALWRALLVVLGFEEADTGWDKLHLRMQPPVARVAGTAARQTATLGFHRDTWASNVYAQVNWWAPICPLARKRTMAFYPGAWSRPVRNDSAGWDWLEIAALIREKGRNAVSPERLVPHALEAPRAREAVPVLIAPGELLAFSGAHGHAGVGNTTALTRITIETRTARISDIAAGRAAPNLDGAAPRIALGWFRRMSDGRRLSELTELAGVAPPPPRAG